MSNDLRMTLARANEWTDTDGRCHRREEWTIVGGKVAPAWRRKTTSQGHDLGPHEDGWGPSSRFTLYVIDGEVDVRLGSYGGIVWPTAWPELFQSVRQGTYQAAVEITDEGLMCRAAALYGASCADADVRLLP